jgi:hypothetical protein
VLSILFVEMLILVTFVLDAIEGKLMLTNSITILFLSATPHSGHFFSTVSSYRIVDRSLLLISCSSVIVAQRDSGASNPTGLL